MHHPSSPAADSFLFPSFRGDRRSLRGEAWSPVHPVHAQYADVSGLCKVATLAEIEAQGWSLNPGRYVGVAPGAVDDVDFAERLEELNEELEVLNAEARELEERIGENVALLLETI